MPRIARLLLAAVLLSAPAVVQAADDQPLSANWKIFLPLQGGDQPLWLIQLQEKDGKWTGKLLDTATELAPLQIERVRVAKETLRFEAKGKDTAFEVELLLPPDKEGRLRGVIRESQKLVPVELQRSTAASLKPYDLDRELLARQAHGATVVKAGLALMKQAAQQKARPEEVRSWAAKSVQAARDYGSAYHRQTLLEVCQVLSTQKGFESIALPYARQAERMLTPKDRLAVHKRTLDLLAKVLEQSGKADEARAVKARLDKMDFAIKPIAFTGRKGKSTKVVLVELFTNSQSPSCAGMELALDALTKTFKPSEVAVLQYHLNLKDDADPLNNPSDLSRMEEYPLPGVPTAVFDGRTPISAASGVEDASDRYESFVEAVKKVLESPAEATIELMPQRAGDKITVKVQVSDIKVASEALRLRVALVEDEVRYAGRSKVDRHHHVVRAFLGGEKGLEVTKGKPFSKTISVDLGDLRKRIKKHLDDAAKVITFPDKERPLELSKLHIVAFVQNGETGEILQTAQVEVPAGKEAKKEEGK